MPVLAAHFLTTTVPLMLIGLLPCLSANVFADSKVSKSEDVTLKETVANYATYSRTDANSKKVHQQLLAKTKQGQIDIYFQGDSITRRWGAIDYPQYLALWNESFHGWNAANFAWGGDNTHHMLWRMQNGELEGLNPKVIALQGGTNNLPWRNAGTDFHVEDVVLGIQAIIVEFQTRFPDATIVLTGVFIRPQNKKLAEVISQINERLEGFCDGDRIRYVDINDKLTDESGNVLPGMLSDGLHLDVKGYEVWEEALGPVFEELLGPKAEKDLAPPATGNPAAVK